MNDNKFNGVSQVNFNNDFEKFLNLDDSTKLTRQVSPIFFHAFKLQFDFL